MTHEAIFLTWIYAIAFPASNVFELNLEINSRVAFESEHFFRFRIFWTTSRFDIWFTFLLHFSATLSTPLDCYFIYCYWLNGKLWKKNIFRTGTRKSNKQNNNNKSLKLFFHLVWNCSGRQYVPIPISNSKHFNFCSCPNITMVVFSLFNPLNLFFLGFDSFNSSNAFCTGICIINDPNTKTKPMNTNNKRLRTKSLNHYKYKISIFLLLPNVVSF